MKLKSTVLYQIYQYKWTFLVYYGMIVLIFVINLIASNRAGFTAESGTEFATPVFLFVIGAMFMRVPFQFYLQNGVSRRTCECSILLSSGVFAAGMTIATNLIAAVTQWMGFRVTMVYYELYYFRYQYGYHVEGFEAAIFFEGLLWCFCLNLLGYMMGVFFSLVMYRTNRMQKVVIFGGLVAVCGLLLPGLDMTVGKGEIYYFFRGILSRMLGYGNPYIAGGIFLGLAVLFGAGQYLLLRKAPVRGVG